MHKSMIKIVWVCLVAFAATLQPGCSGTLFFRPARPPIVVEQRSSPPHASAKWVNGRYKWDGRRKDWVWAPGYWKNGHRKSQGNR